MNKKIKIIFLGIVIILIAFIGLFLITEYDLLNNKETEVVNFENSTLLKIYTGINGRYYDGILIAENKTYGVTESAIESLNPYLKNKQITPSPVKPFKAEVSKVQNENGNYTYVIEKIIE